jgi:hypothetical protein
MLLSLSAALLVAGAVPDPAPASVQAGRADWNKFPALQKAVRSHPTRSMVDRVSEMLRSEQCSLPGQSPSKFDITVPYLVLVRPDGAAERVVVADLGCPTLETYVGSIVLKLSELGDFRPTGHERPTWYSSKLNFNLRDR